MKYLHYLENQKKLELLFVVDLLISGHALLGSMVNSLKNAQALHSAANMIP